MPFAKLLESWPCQKYYCIIPQWGPPQLNDKKKMQKEKSNFRRYNEIKTKCLLSLSNVEMFIKIANVRVWCWGKKCLWTIWGCFLKIKIAIQENSWPFAWSEHEQKAVLTPVTSLPLYLSLFSLHLPVNYPFSLLFVLHMRLKGLSLQGPKPPPKGWAGGILCHRSAWRAHPGIISFTISGSLHQCFK